MVVLNHLYTRIVFPVLATVLLAWPGAAAADDWRHKLRQGSQAGVARPQIVEPDSAFAYTGSFRSGYSSNANEDFDPVPSAYSESAHDLELSRKDGDRVLGLLLRGSIDAAYAADILDYADFETRATAAWETASGGVNALAAGYRFEHDGGLRSHDVGASATLRRQAGGRPVFTTLTVNTFTHEDQQFFGLSLDRSDSDRLRTGFEQGVELPAHGDFTPTVSVGAVDVRHAQSRDNLGFRRDSSAVFARAGVTVSGKGRLGGEAGVLLFHRRYSDPVFDDRTVLLPEAELTWTISDKTGLAFSYLADLEETPVYGASNQMTVTAALTLSHRLDDKHSLSAVVFDQRDSYFETDLEERTRGAGLELTRKLNETLALSLAGEFEHATASGVDEAADTWKFSLGLITAFSK